VNWILNQGQAAVWAETATSRYLSLYCRRLGLNQTLATCSRVELETFLVIIVGFQSFCRSYYAPNVFFNVYMLTSGSIWHYGPTVSRTAGAFYDAVCTSLRTPPIQHAVAPFTWGSALLCIRHCERSVRRPSTTVKEFSRRLTILRASAIGFDSTDH